MDSSIEHKASILIVEDDALIGDSTRFQLKKAQYKTVGIASNTQEAIKMAKEKHPDLILMDINLGSSGDGVLAAHEIQKFADIPFIFLTAYTDSETVDRVKKTSPYGYLIKPYDYREMLVAIETALYKHSYDKKLKEQELMFRTIANFAYEWEFWILLDMSFKYCSPSCERITGYTAEEFIKNPKLLFDIVYTKDRAEFEKHFKQFHNHRREETVKTYQFRIFDKQGEVKYIRHTCSPIIDEQNNYLGRRVTNVDITESKIYENSLKESEERYLSLINTSLDGYWLADNDGNILDVNEEYCRMTGYSRAELLTMNIRDLEAREQPPDVRKHFKKIMYDGFDRFESINKRADGSIIEVEVNTRYLTTQKKFVTFINDITNRKNAENELRNSESRFRQVLENSLDASYKRNLLTNSYEYLSPVFEKITGYTVKEFTSMSILEVLELIHPEDRELVEKAVSESMQDDKGKSYYIDYRLKNKAGIYLWFRDQFIIVRDEKNIPLAMIGSVGDITEKLAQQNELSKYQEHLEELLEEQTGQIRKQNIFFRTLIDTIPNVIFVEDTEFRFTEVNKSFEDFFGVNRDMVLGKTIADFVPDEIAKVARQNEEKLLEDHKTVIYESFVPNKNNNMVPVIIYKSSFGIPGEKPDGITAMLIDNTKQKELEITILESLKKEKELSEVKTNFISMASHEFRTPLTSILSSADLLELYHAKWDESKIITHLNRIQNSVQVITSLLDEVLALNRSERGIIELNPSLFDLQEFCSEIIDQIKSQMSPNQNIIYEFKLSNRQVAADMQILNHILNNLLNNAIKYSPDGGNVVLAVEEDDESLIFSVQDNGIGIPEEDQKNLFEPFFRAKNSSGIKGSGLGLTIIKRYVEIHKGEISFQSKLGEGTKFIIKIKKLIVQN